MPNTNSSSGISNLSHLPGTPSTESNARQSVSRLWRNGTAMVHNILGKQSGNMPKVLRIKILSLRDYSKRKESNSIKRNTVYSKNKKERNGLYTPIYC